jgi:hypothetical protein
MMTGTKWPSKAFFLVGAPRCGTTSMASALAQHPQVCFSKPKEPHFFSSVREDDVLARLEVDYIRTFFPQDLLSREVLGEGSPSYLYSPRAIRMIDRIFPDARFLVIVRNPLEMIPSYHARLLFLLDEDVADFETAWRLQSRRAKGESIPSGCRDPRLLQYANIGRVGTRLADLIGLVGRARVKPIIFDDFRSAPVTAYREVLEFLRLEDDERTEVGRMNGTKAYRSRLIQRLLIQPPALAQHLLAPKTGRPSHRSVAGRLRKRLRKANVVRRHWPAISTSMRHEVANSCRDDVELLGRLLGRDLTHWLDAEITPEIDISRN